MHRHLRHARRTAADALRYPASFLLVLVLLFFAAFSIGSPANDFSSAEVKFADASYSGLSIVPASCPSSPDYAGQCGSTPPPQGACAVWTDSATVNQGQSTTLHWNGDQTQAFSPYGIRFTYKSGSISSSDAGFGTRSVGAAGSAVITPTHTASYVYSEVYNINTNPGVDFPASCDTVVTVTPCTPQNICSSGNVVNSCTGEVVHSCSACGTITTTVPTGAPWCDFLAPFPQFFSYCNTTTNTAQCTSCSDGSAPVNGVCPAVTDVCPNLGGVQATVPSGYHLDSGQCIANGSPSFDLKVNGSDTPPSVRAGDTFYFTWTSQNVQNCTPYMVSGTDVWWTGGAGVSAGGYLPTSYGNPSSYASTGLGRSLSVAGTYTYAARCESTVAFVWPAWLQRITNMFTAFAATLYDSVPVTVTICPANWGQVCNCNGTIQCNGSCSVPSGAPGGCIPASVLNCTNGSDWSVRPSLVQKNSTVTVHWDGHNMASCSVSGNGNTWGPQASDSKTSNPIRAQSTYSISCVGLDNVSHSCSSVVNVAPTFCEPGAVGCE